MKNEEETCECGKKADGLTICELCGCFLCKGCLVLFEQNVNIGQNNCKPICQHCYDDFMGEQDEY